MIESDNALTSPLGEIQYIPTNGSENAKITDSDFEMRSFISAPSSVLLKSKEKKEVAITLQAPQSDTGTYLGGITFITNLDQTVSEDTKRDPNAYYFDIENRIGFAVAVEWDMPKKQSSTFSIENAGIRLIPAGVQSFIEFRNDNPSILHHFSASYTIKDKNDAELFAGKITNISFAPKTLVRYPIMWKSSSLTDGTYTLVMDADINGKKESHAVHFNVNRDFVEQYISDTGNDLPLTSKTTSSSMLIFLGAGLIATFVLVFFLVSKARHKGKDDA
jgi:hypothetical protein